MGEYPTGRAHARADWLNKQTFQSLWTVANKPAGDQGRGRDRVQPSRLKLIRGQMMVPSSHDVTLVPSQVSRQSPNLGLPMLTRVGADDRSKWPATPRNNALLIEPRTSVP